MRSCSRKYRIYHTGYATALAVHRAECRRQPTWPVDHLRCLTTHASRSRGEASILNEQGTMHTAPRDPRCKHLIVTLAHVASSGGRRTVHRSTRADRTAHLTEHD